MFAMYRFALRLLVGSCLIGGTALVHAENVTFTVGQGTTANYNLSTNTWNFAVTSSGAQQGLTATNFVLQLNAGSKVSDPVTIRIYSGFGGTGTVLYETNLTAAAIKAMGSNLSLSMYQYHH